jgi:hypothetical protein
MTRLSASLMSSLTLALVLPLVPAPALASGPGGVVWNFTASSPEQAREIREGLELLSQNNRGPSRGPAPSASVGQRGNGHAAGIAQGGPNNLGVISQNGCNHTGTIHQTGGNNAYGIVQYGCGATTHVTQTGGQTGITYQFGY